MEDKFLVFGKYVLEVRAFRVNPEFQHTPWTMHASGDEAEFLALADVSNIHEDNIGIFNELDGVYGLDLLDPFLCLLYHLGR